MAKVKDNFGFSQEEMLNFYEEGRIVFLHYRSMYWLQYNEKTGKFYLAFSEKVSYPKIYTVKGAPRAITLSQWLGLKPYKIW